MRVVIGQMRKSLITYSFSSSPPINVVVRRSFHSPEHVEAVCCHRQWNRVHEDGICRQRRALVSCERDPESECLTCLRPLATSSRRPSLWAAKTNPTH
eukprot:173749-Hanusia_phi.AAC.2